MNRRGPGCGLRRFVSAGALRRSLIRALPVGALLLSGCFLLPDDGPGGWTFEVQGAGGVLPGAVLLEVQAEGIDEFVPLGATRVATAPVAGFPGRYRVLAAAPGSESLRFELRVGDRSKPRPGAVVLSAADRSNAVLPATDGVTVRISRR